MVDNNNIFGNEGYEEGSSYDDSEPQGSYYDHVMSTNKYADAEEMAKGNWNKDKHIKVVEGENKKMREYIAQFQPFVPILDEYLKSPEYAKKYGKPANQNTNVAQPQQPTGKPDAVKEIVESMLGSKLGEINARLTRNETNEILKTMRQDKDNFPYMTKEVEDTMGKILSETNNSFPLDWKGLTWLYKAAVGEHLPKILSKEKDNITNSNYANFARKTSARTENDRDGNAGGQVSDDDDVRNRIKSASRGLFS